MKVPQQAQDDQFKPRDIRKRSSYRKISNQIKITMARLYYHENVKMSKLVKKYNISFSTITDILKRYQEKGQNLLKIGLLEKCKESLESEDFVQIKIEVKEEISPDYVFATLKEEKESPLQPQYVFYNI